jgi:hypothetical protein
MLSYFIDRLIATLSETSEIFYGKRKCPRNNYVDNANE